MARRGGRLRRQKGKAFKGRKCAEKANAAFRYMQADLYNLYPAIGAVNAMRSNYRYSMLPGVLATFGTCSMKIDGRPRGAARSGPRHDRPHGALHGRRYRGTYRLSRQDRQLMEAWDRQYPVDKWECTRARRIEAIQGNPNERVKEACRKAGL